MVISHLHIYIYVYMIGRVHGLVLCFLAEITKILKSGWRGVENSELAWELKFLLSWVCCMEN